MTLIPNSIGSTSPTAGSGLGALSRSAGAVCVLLSAVLFVLNTRHGMGILPDSTRYMNIGPEPYDAPGYSWLLAATVALGMTMDSGARLIGFVLTCTNTFLIWHLLVNTAAKQMYALLGTLLIILSPVFVYFHATAMSEPLFIFLILLCLVCLHGYTQDHQRLWLVGCGLAVGAASLTRFTAPPLALAVAAALLLDRRQRTFRRLVDAGIVCAVSGGIFFAWAAISTLLVGRTTGRALEFDGNLGVTNWLVSLDAATTMLLPSQIPAIVRNAVFASTMVAVACLLVRYGARMVRKPAVGQSEGGSLLPVALGFFVPLYLAFFWLATQIEANLYLNGRYALPAYVATVLAVAMAVPALSSNGSFSRNLRRAFTAFVVIILAANVVRSADQTRKDYRQGIGYTSVTWTSSPVMQAVSQLPANSQVYSNGPDAVGYLAKHPAKFIPRRWLLRTGKEDPANPYDKQIETLRTHLAAGNSYVVFLDHVDWRDYVDTEATLKTRLGLRLVADLPDGRIYTGTRQTTEGADNGPGS